MIRCNSTPANSARLVGLRYNPVVSEFVCKLAESETELRAALALRQAVFVMEQGVDAELETDGLDAAALHVVATAAGAVVGTARIRFPEAATAKV